MSDDVQHAVLAAEDRTFYENKGVSPKGIGRAVYVKAHRRLDAGRLDDHPAVREELLPHGRPHREPQGPRVRHLAEDRAAGVEGRHPAELPEHHLLRSRLVRRADREPGVLRRRRLEGDAQPERAARRRHPLARAVRPGRREAAGGRAVGLRARRHGRRGLGDARGAGEGEVPEGREAQGDEPARRHERLPARGGARRA
nr:transglycosylase domain-containing protein [Angustibacter aerolatus]